MTHAELRQWFYASLTRQYLQGELQALYHWCMEEIHGWSRAVAYQRSNEHVTPQEWAKWKDVVKRLEHGEPVQYVFEKAIFMGFSFKVNRDVLIPRPETEELVQLVLSRFSEDSTLRILDAGTGSGCIAVAIKKLRPRWEVVGVDVSRAALEMARHNAKLNHVDVQFVHGDLKLDPPIKLADLIVSNPPYIPHGATSLVEKSVLLYEPQIALFAPPDNRLFYIQRVLEWARVCGAHHAFVETHADITPEEIEAICPEQSSVHIQRDMSAKPRFLVYNHK